MKLSKVKKIDLREVWQHEALHFTKWLAEKENLSLLSDAIGIEISLIQTEASVGKFSVDILAEEENTGRKVVVENQLESTNHDHLGKLITYASGFDAEIIIWIVKDVRSEHKQAIDWLNEHSDERANYFAIKMEVLQIDDSPYAPQFQVISQPNDWAKAVKKGSGESGLSDIKLMQLDFWTDFKEFGQERNSKLNFRKPFPQHWYDISVGIPRSHLSLVVDTRNNQIRCEFYIPDEKELFKGLENFKSDIENELDYDLEWMFLEGKKASRIRTVMEGDVSNSKKWEEYFLWLLNTCNDFQRVFSKYYKKL
jgi:hypothetical protein